MVKKGNTLFAIVLPRLDHQNWYVNGTAMYRLEQESIVAIFREPTLMDYESWLEHFIFSSIIRFNLIFNVKITVYVHCFLYICRHGKTKKVFI